MSRAEKIAKNMKFALLSQVLIILVHFVLRKFFVFFLSEEYLGLNGLFSDILSMLSMAELGFGVSIVYSLYAPLARGDQEKIKSLMHLFQTIYRIIGIFVLMAGLLLTPFLSFFVKEMPDIPHIRLIYMLNVLNSALSYFFIYKASLLFADQKKYMELLINTGIKTACAVIQVIILALTKNYLLYLLIQLTATLVQNVLISKAADRTYPYLKEKQIEPLDQKDKKVIRENVAAMAFHKFGDVMIFSTDSILMAKFVSVGTVGLYSNYMLIRKALINVIGPTFNAISSAMGNLNACEGEEKRYEAFQHILFFSAWMFGFMAICLEELYNPFIQLWLGEGYLFSQRVVTLIVISFYIYCMRIPVNSSKEAMGLFKYDKYKSIFESVLNLVLSIFLAKRIGIAGVILGTIASSLMVPCWIEAYVVYRYGFHQRVWKFYLQYLLYALVTLGTALLTGFLCGLVSENIWGFLLKMGICVGIPNSIYWILYRKTRSFQYLKRVLAELIAKRLQRLPIGKKGE